MDVGDDLINVTYNGDGITPQMNVTSYAGDVYSNDTAVEISLSDNVSGNVIVVVDGKQFNGTVINGKVLVNTTGLSAGVKEAIITFLPENGYVREVTQKTNFVVNKHPSVVNITQKGYDIIANVDSAATGNITFYVNGEKINATIENGQAVLPNVLTVGNNSIVAVYEGDENFTGSNDNEIILVDATSEVQPDVTTDGNDTFIEIPVPEGQTGYMIITVNGTNYTVPIVNGTAKLNVTGLNVTGDSVNVTYLGDLINPLMNVTVDSVVYPDVSNAVIELSNNANGTVVITVDGKTFNGTVDNGKITVPMDGLDAGVKDAIVEFTSSDINVNNVTQKVKFVIDNAPSNIDIAQKGNGVIISTNGEGNVTVYVNGKEYSVPIKDGNATLDNVLTDGNNSVIVIYDGDKNHNPSSGAATLTVEEKATPNIKVDVDSEKEIITVNVPKDAADDVDVLVDGEKVPGEVSGNKITVDISDLTPGNHSVEVIYDGDKYAPYDNTTDFEVPKVDDYKFDVNATVDKNKATITIDLPEDVDGIVLVDVDGVGYYANVTDGKATLDLVYTDDGNHTVKVIYPGDDKYESGEASTEFAISYKKDTPMDILVPESPVKGNFTAYVKVADDATGYITLEVDGKNFTSEIDNGIAKFDISGISDGKHNMEATYDGDDNYYPNTATAEIEVIKDSNYPMDISQNGKNIDVKLPNDAQGNVTVIIDGNKYSAPIVNGTASVYNPDLTIGLHNISVVYGGDNKYSSKEYHGDIEIVNAVVINAPVVEKYYSGKERFYVYLEDFYGNKISNASVSITINGVTYNRTTDENGSASLAINLNSVHYPVFVSFNGNEEFNATSVTSAVLINPTIYGNDIVKIYKNGTQYWALFLDSEGNPLVNTSVTYNINGVFYNRITNASGWARLNINLERGTYILTAYNPVTGEEASNSIEVISRIVEVHDLFKFYHNDSQYVVRVLAENGSHVGAGEKVVFNIHGVFYTRYTDENGYVQLNINLEPGSYIVTAYYGDCSEGSHIHVFPVLFTTDLSMSAGDGSQFVAHLLDGQGNPYANQEITFNINGVIYHRMTDEEGNARLNINLQQGAYLITSTYIGESNSNTIVIS